MASKTPVNEQITDAVTQANAKSIAESPARHWVTRYQ
ncbi:MAG: RebB family R body protein [Oceanospirillaceae bacterium]|nr:RebB family R body protein [Oceanospirillaceae bacterium]